MTLEMTCRSPRPGQNLRRILKESRRDGRNWLRAAQGRGETPHGNARCGSWASFGAVGRGGKPTVSVSFRTTRSEFIKMYHIHQGAGRKLVAEHIPQVRAGFGGMWTYLSLSREGCNRGVEVFYLAKGRFRLPPMPRPNVRKRMLRRRPPYVSQSQQDARATALRAPAGIRFCAR